MNRLFKSLFKSKIKTEEFKPTKFKPTIRHRMYLASIEQGTKESIKYTSIKLGLDQSIVYFKDTFRVSDDKAKLMSECGLYLI